MTPTSDNNEEMNIVWYKLTSVDKKDDSSNHRKLFFFFVKYIQIFTKRL